MPVIRPNIVALSDISLYITTIISPVCNHHSYSALLNVQNVQKESESFKFTPLQN